MHVCMLDMYRSLCMSIASNMCNCVCICVICDDSIEGKAATEGMLDCPATSEVVHSNQVLGCGLWKHAVDGC